jgi:hypothetical protein
MKKKMKPYVVGPGNNGSNIQRQIFGKNYQPKLTQVPENATTTYDVKSPC